MGCEWPNHDWQPTGKHGVHVEFPTKTDGKRQLYAIFLRCSKCGQDGFRRPFQTLVYTWQKEG